LNKKTLQQPENNELPQACRHAAKKGAKGEHAKADQKIALAAEHRAKPAGNCQHALALLSARALISAACADET
jgi:hypothetical protein